MFFSPGKHVINFFNFLLKKLTFQDNFLQFRIFFLLFYMFFSSGKHVIKNFIYENWNFESFDQFPQKKWNGTNYIQIWQQSMFIWISVLI